jgi:integrating conjugative element protein (TIGR03749 family)
MRLVSKIFAIGFLISLEMSAQADSLSSLTLSNAEIQKLKKYFPTDDSSEHLIWKGDPILITLPLGKEKRIIFPDKVTVDLKGSLNTNQVRIINDNKSIYLTALKFFPTTRIYVNLQDSGEVLLIDLITNNGGSSASQQIDIKKNIVSEINTVISTPRDVSTEQNPDENASYADLIRFAWQQVYAPKRLLDGNLHFQRAPMSTQKFVSGLVYGDKVIAHPESSWVSGSRYVTVIVLRNKYSHKAAINIAKNICGSWEAASLYPRSILQPYGYKEKDTTTLFLISHRPFGDVLGVCHGDA